MKHAEFFGLKPGVKIPLEEMVQKATSAQDFMPFDERKTMLYSTHEPLFDVIDLNKDGHILSLIHI